MNFEKFFHQICLNSYLCSHVCSQCHQSSSAAFSEWLPKQWCIVCTEFPVRNPICCLSVYTGYNTQFIQHKTVYSTQHTEYRVQQCVQHSKQLNINTWKQPGGYYSCGGESILTIFFMRFYESGEELQNVSDSLLISLTFVLEYAVMRQEHIFYFFVCLFLVSYNNTTKTHTSILVLILIRV